LIDGKSVLESPAQSNRKIRLRVLVVAVAGLILLVLFEGIESFASSFGWISLLIHLVALSLVFLFSRETFDSEGQIVSAGVDLNGGIFDIFILASHIASLVQACHAFFPSITYLYILVVVFALYQAMSYCMALRGSFGIFDKIQQNQKRQEDARVAKLEQRQARRKGR